MSTARSSFLRVLFFALVLALLASARAEEDDDHDEHDEETPVDWACTAPCPTAADAAHPCGADEYVASDELSTCTLTQEHIMDVADYATPTHVVPCPSDVCELKCTAEGATADGDFTCFNTTLTMEDTAAEANHRALAMGCEGSHVMPDGKWMIGGHHGSCEAGSVHFHDEGDDHDHDDHDHSAATHPRATFAAVALVLALALAAA